MLKHGSVHHAHADLHDAWAYLAEPPCAQQSVLVEMIRGHRDVLLAEQPETLIISTWKGQRSNCSQEAAMNN